MFCEGLTIKFKNDTTFRRVFGVREDGAFLVISNDASLVWRKLSTGDLLGDVLWSPRADGWWEGIQERSRAQTAGLAPIPPNLTGDTP